MKRTVNKYFLLLRLDLTTNETPPAPAQMEIFIEQLEGWIKDLAAKNKLSDWGNKLSTEGRVIRPNHDKTDTEKRESFTRYLILRAASFDEAVNLAKGCPILQGEGTCVEVRKVEEQ